MTNRLRAALMIGALALAACDDESTGVPRLAVATVAVAPGGRTLVAGETMQLTAYPKTEDGTVLGGRRIDWTSEAVSIATVSPNGLVRAAGVGTTRISATVEGRVGSVDVTVVAAPQQVATVEILNAPARLTTGQQVMLEAVAKAADGTAIGGRTVTWRSSHGPTATVTTDPNSAFAVLSAHAAGTVTITAETGGRSASVAVIVEAPAVVGAIVLNPSDADVWVGGNVRYEAAVLSPAGQPVPHPPALLWTVDDPTVATIDDTGRVLGLRPGTSVVRATANGVQGHALLTVHAVLAGRQRFVLDGDIAPDGSPREVVLGTLTWYGDRAEGEAAREILKSGAVTLETADGVTKYSQQLYFDVVVGEGASARKVAFGSVSDSGTVALLYDHQGDAPGMQFTSAIAQNNPFMGRLETAEHLILRQMIAAAPVLEYVWRRAGE